MSIVLYQKNVAGYSYMSSPNIYYRAYKSKKGCNRMSETHSITTKLLLIIQAQE